MGLIGKTMGLKQNTMGLGKSINVADLPVFLLEVNGANPVLHLYFKAEKGNIAPNCLLLNIYIRSDKVE